MPKITHGKSHTPEWTAWKDMKARCYRKNNSQYKNYGARGIRVCERWLNSAATFLKDMGPRPEGYSLDRIDCDADYSPENCRWASLKTQNRNKSHRHSKTGRTGVCLNPNKEGYVVFIHANRKQHYIGAFDSFDEAVAAREAAEEKYWGKAA